MAATSISGLINIGVGQGDSKTSTNVKNTKGSGMETDQAEQLGGLLGQSAKVLNRNQEAEETDTSITSKRDKRTLLL